MGISSYNLPDALTFIYTNDLESCRISTEASHHLINVLRVRPGQEIIISDGDGNWRLCSLDFTNTSAKNINLVPVGAIIKAPKPPVKIAIGFALTKPANSEITIQKLTELGIENIYPFISERTPIKTDLRMREKLNQRFTKISCAAGEQSRSPYLPKINQLKQFTELIDEFKGNAAILQPGNIKVDKPLLESIKILLIGPEGGFSKDELDMVPTKFTLADTILRSETAAIAAGSIITYLSL